MPSCKVTPLVVALAVLLASCSFFSSDDGGDGLAGRWRWVESTGGWTGRTITPDMPDTPTILLYFGEDGSFSEYIADTLATHGTYTLTQQGEATIINYEVPGDETARPYFLMRRQRVRVEDRNTLVLIDACIDCFVSTYRRGWTYP